MRTWCGSRKGHSWECRDPITRVHIQTLAICQNSRLCVSVWVWYPGKQIGCSPFLISGWIHCVVQILWLVQQNHCCVDCPASVSVRLRVSSSKPFVWQSWSPMSNLVTLGSPASPRRTWCGKRELHEPFGPESSFSICGLVIAVFTSEKRGVLVNERPR